MNARQTADARHETEPHSDATVGNTTIGSPQCQHDNPLHGVHTPSQTGSAQNVAPQQTPQPSQSVNLQRNTPQPSPTADSALDFFDKIMAEVLAEQPIFNLPSIDQVSDWPDDAAPTQQLNTEESTSFQETTDDIHESTPQPHHPQRIDPDSSHPEICQAHETTSKAQGSSDVDEAMKPPDTPSNTAQEATEEDPQAFGALSIPLFDQYPCFAASPDGNRIEIDDSTLQPFRDQKEASFDCNLVRVGTYLELNDILCLKKDNLPLLGLEDTLHKPLKFAIVDPRCAAGNKENQGHKGIVQQGILAQTTHANAVLGLQHAIDAPNTSKQGSQDVQDRLGSRSPVLLLDQSTTVLPPALINMQPHLFDQMSILQPPGSANQEDLVNSQGVPLSPEENASITRPELQLNSPSLWANTLRHAAYSSSDVTSEKHSNQLQPSGIQQIASVRQSSVGLPQSREHFETQPTLLRKASHASSNLRRCPSSGRFRSSCGPVNMNLSIPKHSHLHPSRSLNVKGKEHITPTSIMCGEMPFQFPDNPQHMANPGFAAAVQNVPFDAQQTNMNAQMASGVGVAGDKRGICNIGSSFETPTKKPRIIGLNHLHQQNRREDDSSQTSRIAHKQAPLYQPPLLPEYPQHIITQNQTALSHAQAQNFVIGRQLQWIQPALYANRQAGQSNFGGQKSEATVSSPSKPRSTNVRDECGQLPKRYVCSDCSEAYAFKENCERHFKVVHQNRTVYFCHHCPASYLQSKTMRLHVEKKHHKIDGENSVFPCYWCDFKTNTTYGWSKHVSEIHPGHKNKFRGGAA